MFKLPPWHAVGCGHAMARASPQSVITQRLELPLRITIVAGGHAVAGTAAALASVRLLLLLLLLLLRLLLVICLQQRRAVDNPAGRVARRAPPPPAHAQLHQPAGQRTQPDQPGRENTRVLED